MIKVGVSIKQDEIMMEDESRDANLMGGNRLSLFSRINLELGIEKCRLIVRRQN